MTVHDRENSQLPNKILCGEQQGASKEFDVLPTRQPKHHGFHAEGLVKSFYEKYPKLDVTACHSPCHDIGFKPML